MPHHADSASYQRLGAEHAHLFRDHLLRLDTTTRQQRFAMPASDTFLRTYADTSFALGTLVFGYFEKGHLRGSAELRSLGIPGAAEATFCVEDGWRNRGIGTSLMERTLSAAGEIGASHIYINCLASNRTMQQVARKFSANLTIEAGDVIGHLRPPRPPVEGTFRRFLAKWLAPRIPVL